MAGSSYIYNSFLSVYRIWPRAAQTKVSFTISSQTFLIKQQKSFRPSGCTSDVRICSKTLTTESCQPTRRIYSAGAWLCSGTPRKASTMADRPESSSSCCRDKSSHPITHCSNTPPSILIPCKSHRFRLSSIIVMIGNKKIKLLEA